MYIKLPIKFLSTALTVLFLQNNSFASSIPKVKYNYVSIDSQITSHPLAAKLSVPITENSKKPPVVIVLHGSGGVDERGSLYSKLLNENGIATIEIDMWAARNLNGGLSRPKNVNETLPDILNTIAYLKKLSYLNTNEMGLIGFSWGGVMSMLATQDRFNFPKELKAIVADYPICWAYNKVPSYELNSFRPEVKLLIISGKEDKYDNPNDCNYLIRSLDSATQKNIKLLSLDNATHAFDLQKENTSFFDPYAYNGKGGYVPIKYNPLATRKSMEEIKEFFKMNLLNRSNVTEL